jgi:hypothetical protein
MGGVMNMAAPLWLGINTLMTSSLKGGDLMKV